MNAEYDPSERVALVAVELARAWEMLCGEERHFARVADSHAPPPYAEFSFVIPMTLAHDESTFAVGVLISRADACTVAAAMFDVSPDAVAAEDLADACSEVCNIFSDSIARHLYPNDTVQVGLPFTLNESNYAHVYSASGDGDIYQSHAHGNCLTVIVFTHSDTRFQPLI